MTLFTSERDDSQSRSSSSGWDDSDLLTSSRYDDVEKRPTREEADAVCTALAQYGFEKIKYIARGSYGYVYKMGYRTSRNQPKPRVVAVKVMYAQPNKHLPKRIKVFHKAFDKAMRSRFSQHRRLHEDIDVDTGYFTEDLVYPRVVFPVEVGGRSKEYTLHFMELMTGEALYTYLRTHGHRMQLKNVMTLFCRLLHALHFFHEAGLMFNDLKLENLMVDPITLHVSCIDFYDSNTQCTHTHCTERPRPHIIFTFRDPFHKEGLHEDVWRLGLTMLDILESVYCSHRRHRNRLQDEEDNPHSALPGDLVRDECKESDRYPSVFIRNEVKRVCQKAAATFANDPSYGPPARTLFSQIRTSLMQMLHEHVKSRPSVARLLQSMPWRVCARFKHPPKHQRQSYLPLQRLTPLQRSRKASLVDLNTAKLYVSKRTFDAMNTASSSASTLDEDWRKDAVSGSAYRTTTMTKQARRRKSPRHRVVTPKRKRRESADRSESSTTASSLAALPRTQKAIYKRRKTARQRIDPTLKKNVR